MNEFAAMVAGFGVGLSLIVAIGAQNAYVLRQGLQREHVGPIVAVCALSDALLISLGITGIGATVTHLPWLLGAVRIVGAAFLIGYGVFAAYRAHRGEPDGLSADGLSADDTRDEPIPGRGDAPAGTLTQDMPLPATLSATLPTTAPATPPGDQRTTLRTALLTTAALTWLNPHVYLDTVFLLGSVANSHGDPGRWYFGIGAATASIVWFSALGFGSRVLRPILRGRTAWRVLDFGIAFVMIALGLSLLRGQ
ncbi:MAG: LysE/ArgO family amino acid transporter [Candidatus Nanopelagicales bacterium]